MNQLNTFASEVSRVAHEVGTEGKLGVQAKVAGADGIWKELTDNVNTMADNLTNQVRDIAQVSKSVARGDLTKKVTVEVRGEMLDLKNTINTMVDQVRICVSCVGVYVCTSYDLFDLTLSFVYLLGYTNSSLHLHLK